MCVRLAVTSQAITSPVYSMIINTDILYIRTHFIERLSSTPLSNRVFLYHRLPFGEVYNISPRQIAIFSFQYTAIDTNGRAVPEMTDKCSNYSHYSAQLLVCKQTRMFGMYVYYMPLVLRGNLSINQSIYFRQLAR